jgi:hypothetical protein
MHKTKQLLDDLQYLEAAGLTTQQLRSLHHWSNRPEAAARVSFATARSYFAREQNMQANNAAFADRIRLVADLHQRGFIALVEQALLMYPL